MNSLWLSLSRARVITSEVRRRAFSSSPVVGTGTRFEDPLDRVRAGMSVGTPHSRINKLFKKELSAFGDNPPKIYLKHEETNPAGSIKDRIGVAMIDDAEARGRLDPSTTTIVEMSSGNTGIALAMAGAAKGYKVKIFMPDSMSVERVQLLHAYGAECVLTPREMGASGCIKVMNSVIDQNPSYWNPMQFANPVNPAIHARTTAREMARDFPEGIDILVAGLGTGGHSTGCTRVFRDMWPSHVSYAVEAEESDVMGHENPAEGSWLPHRLMGMGPDFKPDNFDLKNCNGGIVKVTGDDAWEMTRRIAKEEGILVGPTTGANLAAIRGLLCEGKVEGGQVLLSFIYDSGERYLSLGGLWGKAEATTMGHDVMTSEQRDKYEERVKPK